MKHQSLLVLVAGAAMLFSTIADARNAAGPGGAPGGAAGASSSSASASSAGSSSSGSGGGGGGSGGGSGGAGAPHMDFAVLQPVAGPPVVAPPPRVRHPTVQPVEAVEEYGFSFGCELEARQYNLYGHDFQMFVRACVNQKIKAQ